MVRQIKQKLSPLKKEIQFKYRKSGKEGNSNLLILNGENNKFLLSYKYNQFYILICRQIM